MDYKFIILIVAIFALFFFLLRESETIKTEIDRLRSDIEDNTKTLRSKFQSDLNACVNKLKTYNADCINQVRKMNLIQSQPITYVSNSYTDTETEHKENINMYLSDIKEQTNHVTSSHLSETLPRSDKMSLKANDKTSEKRSRLSKYSSTSERAEADFKIKYNIDDIKPNENNTDHNIENLMATVNNRIEENNVENNEDDVISSKSHKSSEHSKNSYISETDSSSENITIDMNEYKTDVIDTPDSLEVDEANNIKSETNNIEDRANINTVNETIEDNSVNDSDSSIISINRENITIGSSKKNEKGKKVNITMANNRIELSNLEDEDAYTKKSLEEIAKNLSLPITHVIGNKRIPYKKNELYIKIKEKLSV